MFKIMYGVIIPKEQKESKVFDYTLKKQKVESEKTDSTQSGMAYLCGFLTLKARKTKTSAGIIRISICQGFIERSEK